MVFIDMGDQFLALSEGRRQGPDDSRHFGLVVDDHGQLRDLAERVGARMVEGLFNFFGPWGNRVEVVEYRSVQFTKAAAVLGRNAAFIDKSEKAKTELRRKGSIWTAPKRRGYSELSR